MSELGDVDYVFERIDAAYTGALNLRSDILYDERQEILEEIRNLLDMLERYKENMFVVTPVAIEVTLNAVMRVRNCPSQSDMAELGCDSIVLSIHNALEYSDLDFDVSGIEILEVREQEVDGDYDVDVTERK